MLTVPLKAIPSKGYTLTLTHNEGWVLEMLANALGGQPVDNDSISGQIELRKHENIVDLTGEIRFSYHPLCARCGRQLTICEKIPLKANLAPLYAGEGHRKKHAHEETEVELTREDLDFCFYENDEIRVDTIVNDEIVLALPYNYYCPEPCRPPRSQDPRITTGDKTDPRWHPLKDLKSLKK